MKRKLLRLLVRARRAGPSAWFIWAWFGTCALCLAANAFLFGAHWTTWLWLFNTSLALWAALRAPGVGAFVRWRLRRRFARRHAAFMADMARIRAEAEAAAERQRGG